MQNTTAIIFLFVMVQMVICSYCFIIQASQQSQVD